IPVEAWRTFGGAATGFGVIFSICLATFPGELVENIFPTSTLFNGEVDEVPGKPLSLFSNRLVLLDQRFVDPDKLDKTEISRSFRGRDLRRAMLNRSDLRKADFTGANLPSREFFSGLSVSTCPHLPSQIPKRPLRK